MVLRNADCGTKKNKWPLRVRNVFAGPSSSRRSLRASMTVEASLVLPLFLFFMANVLYLFEAVRLQSGITAALHEAGTQICEYAWYMEHAVPGEDGDAADPPQLPEEVRSAGLSFLLSEAFVRGSVEKSLGRSYLDHSCLEGGAASISYLRCSILREDGIVDLTADYRVRPLIPIRGFEGFSLQSRFYGHAWIGRDGAPGEEKDSSHPDDEETVFITPSGSVYHRSPSCTYLKPRLMSLPAKEVGSARSRDGSRYYACESCHPKKHGVLIITPDGNRYHASADCPALHRDPVEVPLSLVKDTRRPCSKCGGS